MTRFIDHHMVADITMTMNGQNQDIAADVLDDMTGNYNADYNYIGVDDVAAVVRAAYARACVNDTVDTDAAPIVRSLSRGDWDDDFGGIKITAEIINFGQYPTGKYDKWDIWVQCDRDSDNGAPFFDRANPDCKVTLIGANGTDWDVKEDVLPMPDWIIWDIINTLVPTSHDFY